MKRILLTQCIALLALIASAQVSITVNVPIAGGLRSALIAAQGNAATITSLTVTGNIDARDVKFMRDSMPVLAVLDIEAVQIKSYNGTSGTNNYSTSYQANKIPDYSFWNTVTDQSKTSLTSIKLPNSLTSIGWSAFSGCNGLVCALTIPKSVTSIEGYAFQLCSGLSGPLILPNAIISIGDGAFQNCKGFTGTLNIPRSVKTIGVAAFESCSGFNGNLIISNSVTSIGSNAFYYCTGFTGDIVIPNSVTKINHDIFMGCSGFNGTLFIPNSVTAIVDGPFYECSGLQKIIVDKLTPVAISNYAFTDVNKSKCELLVPIGAKSAYQAASYWNEFTNITEAIFVTLNTQGGNPVAPITTTLTNSIISEPVIPIRDGYAFAGWYKEVSCSNIWNFSTDIVSAPITLYAKWTNAPQGIEIQKTINLKIHPNPASTILYLSNLPQNAEILIFGMDGKLIKQQRESTIDINDLPKGLYLLKIITKEGSIGERFVKI